MTESTSSPKNNTMMAGVAIFAVIALLTVGAVMAQKKSEPMTETSTPTASVAPAASSVPQQAVASPTNNPAALAQAMKDGTYEVVGEYVSPGGPETIGVSITLKDGVITEATVTPQAVLAGSQRFQGEFASNYKPMVIGKKITDVKLDKVAGSSLTPKGFNNALEKVIVEAQS